MRPICLLAILVALTSSHAAPAPKRTNAKSAVIDAGNDKNVAGVLASLVHGAPLVIRENKEVSDLVAIRHQYDWGAWVKKNIRVERVKGTSLVRVSFLDGTAKEQAVIINAVVEHYLKTDVGGKRNSLTLLLELLKDELAAKRQGGVLTPEEEAKAVQKIKKCEERIQALPSLVERAKAP